MVTKSNKRSLEESMVNIIKTLLDIQGKQKDCFFELKQKFRRQKERLLTEKMRFAELEANVKIQQDKFKSTKKVHASSEYEEAIEELETELQKQREEIHRLNYELMQAKVAKKLYSDKLEDLENFDKHHSEEEKRFIEELQKTKQRANTLEQENAKLHLQCDVQLLDIQHLTSQIDVLNKHKETFSDAANHIKDCEEQVRTSVQVAEAAIIEKDNALLREQQCKNDLMKLDETLKKLTIEAGERTKKKLEKANNEWNGKMKKICQEILQKEQELTAALTEKTELETRLGETELKLQVMQVEMLSSKEEWQKERLQLLQKMSQIEAHAHQATNKEKAAKLREEKAKEMHKKQTEELVRRLKRLTEGEETARATAAKLATQNRLLEQSSGYDKQQIQADADTWRKKADEAQASIRNKNQEIEIIRQEQQRKLKELGSSHDDEKSSLQQRLQEMKTKHERMLSQHAATIERARLESASMRQELEQRLQLAEDTVTSLKTNLAEEAARSNHISKRLHTALARLQEFEDNNS